MAADKTKPPVSKRGGSSLLNFIAPLLVQQMAANASGFYKDAGFGIDFPITAGEDYETEGITNYSPGRLLTDSPGSFYNPPMPTYLPIDDPGNKWYGTGSFHDDPMSTYSFKPQSSPYDMFNGEMMRKSTGGWGNASGNRGIWDDVAPGRGPLQDFLNWDADMPPKY